MLDLRLVRYAFSLGLAVALLAGCGGALNGTATMPQGAVRTRAHGVSGSWLKREASGEDLVYLAQEQKVFVYSYPGGKYVGAPAGVRNAVALCSDTSGNVWVVDAAHKRSTLLKYSHDGSNPTARLHLEARGSACAVDPSTGSLAVGTLNSSVAVWANGQAAPTLYSTSAFFKEVRTVSYDGSGDLYMGSLSSHKSAAWLPKGGTTVEKFDITTRGSYGWDGQYFVIGPADGFSEPMKLYNLNGNSGTVAGKIRLKNCAPSYDPPSFSIAGSELAVSCGWDETNSLDYYDYPKGGNPINTIVPGSTGSVAISVAPSQHRR